MSCLEQTRVLHASWLDETQRLIWSVCPWVLPGLGRGGAMSCLEQTHVLHASWLDKTQRLICSVVLGSCRIWGDVEQCHVWSRRVCYMLAG